MARSDSSRDEFERVIREYIKSLLERGISRREMCEVLEVTRQAISSYVIGRTTPKPHLVRRLLLVWPTELELKDAKFGPEAFGGLPQSKPVPVAYQPDLFARLCSAQAQNVKLDVEKEDGSEEVELRFSIRIASKR